MASSRHLRAYGVWICYRCVRIVGFRKSGLRSSGHFWISDLGLGHSDSASLASERLFNLYGFAGL